MTGPETEPTLSSRPSKGLATTVTVAGTAAGPLLLAVGFEAAGSYTPVLAFSAIRPAALSVVSPFLPLARDGRIL